jgi:hypothetical protein
VTGLLQTEVTPGKTVGVIREDGQVEPCLVVPVSSAGAVSSVFGRIGAILAQLNDYAASLVNNDSSVTGATVADALDALEVELAALQAQVAGNAATFSGAAILIDWAVNPRALVTQTSAIVFTFLPPQSREVVLIVDNQTSGGGFATFSWPANCRFTAGLKPDQETGISVYKLEYEASLNVYFVYAIGMGYLP